MQEIFKKFESFNKQWITQFGNYTSNDNEWAVEVNHFGLLTVFVLKSGLKQNKYPENPKYNNSIDLNI